MAADYVGHHADDSEAAFYVPCLRIMPQSWVWVFEAGARIIPVRLKKALWRKRRPDLQTALEN